MPTLTYLGDEYSCATAIKGADYIHLLNEAGVMIAAFDEIKDFSGFKLTNGSYTSPTADHDCYLAVIRPDGTFGKGGHKCSDIPMTAADVGAMTFYSSLEQLGLTAGSETIAGIIGAMANNSMLVMNVSTDPTAGGNNPATYPSPPAGLNYMWGLLTVKKWSNARAEIDFMDVRSTTPRFFKKSWRSGTESGWASDYNTLNKPNAADVGAVPTTRKVNGKPLSTDVTLSATDVGARPDTWMPNATDVGARPDTWMPNATDVGARPDTWMPNAENVGAVALNGSNTMTGDLTVAKANAAITAKNNATHRSARLQSNDDGSAYLHNILDSNHRSCLRLKAETDDLASALMLSRITGSNQEDISTYNVLHTGNKSFGEYTGNGSDATRRIETGGIGRAAIVWSAFGVAVLTRSDCFHTYDGSFGVLDQRDGHVEDGTIILATGHSVLNGSGVTYCYQLI